jgi:hypothetical protein
LSGRHTPKLQKTPQVSEVSTFEPVMSRHNSNKSMLSINESEAHGSFRDGARPSNPLVRLEETFTGYIAAIQSRKGNIVGRMIRNRAAADELSINAIYNSFIENPFDQRAADEVTVDVLFVAFEKFLRLAWKDQMGYVMSVQTLDALQERAKRSFSGEFAEYVRGVLSEMAPQNRRAFIAVVKLLADLLDGCGNDGDRGALTVAFAELLIVEGRPHDYINLLDRMVDEQERLFDDIGPGAVNGFGSIYGSVNGNRSNPSATASITSNTSSLRKRFTENLFRQNSANSDRPSMWRTLSKNSNRVLEQGGNSNPSSLSKGSLNRARSIESPNRRPMSRDRPTVLGTFDDRPSSSHGLGSRLSTVDEPGEDQDKRKPKHKRRSSLSDLKTLTSKLNLNDPAPFTRSPGDISFVEGDDAERSLTTPKSSTPSKIPAPGSIMNRGRGVSALTGSPMLRDREKQKENIPYNSSTLPRSVGNLTERPLNISSTPDVVTIKDLWAANSTPTQTTPKSSLKTPQLSSNIPTLHGHASPSTRVPTATSKAAPQKLRLQSPQKLRERLQNEAKAISEAETSLQNELSKIGEEMAKLTASSHHSPSSPYTPEIAELMRRVKDMEKAIPEAVRGMSSRNDAIKVEVEKSLQASEFKVKGLDQLLKESGAENELLYEKFNLELGKVVTAVKGKNDGRAELVAKLKEASEEVGRVKKDNARLKRELVSLRGVLKAHENGGSTTIS